MNLCSPAHTTQAHPVMEMAKPKRPSVIIGRRPSRSDRLAQ